MPVPSAERRTEGPDRNNPCLNCRDFHDASPERFGVLQHLCCCNTCTTIRPGFIRDGIDHLHCCRCLPRYLMLLFVPYGGVCCRSGSTPMAFTLTNVVDRPDGALLPVSSYRGSLFGYTVTAELGRLYDEYDAYGDCVWRFTVEKDSFFEELAFAVDDITVSCLDVSGIVLAEVEGPNGCTGTLMLANAEIGRIPFILREDIPSVLTTGTPPEGQEEFVDLYPACGYCDRVCRILCVYGAGEWREFIWFEDASTEQHGWSHLKPGTEITDYIYLEDNEYGECILQFDFDGITGPPDQVIDIEQGCACGMKEVALGSFPGGTVQYTIRCGFCSCWEFYCGTCRCVPRYLCVQTYIGNTFTPNQIFEWDETELAWLSISGSNDLVFYLQPDDEGECKVVAEIYGYESLLDLSAVIGCGVEHVSKFVATLGQQLDRGNDFLFFTMADTFGDESVWIRASAPVYECDVGPCTEATPCRDECGSHPAELTALLHGFNDSYAGDEPGWDDVVCDVEVTLHYWERVDWTGTQLEHTCGYVGWYHVGECQSEHAGILEKWINVELSNGLLTVYEYYEDGVDLQVYSANLTESCDPYYGDGGIDPVGLTSCWWGCLETVQRVHVTVTE